MSSFKVGDEVYINYPILRGHVCIVDKIEGGRIRLHHPTVNFQGYHTNFPLNDAYIITLVTPLDKLL